MQDSILDHVESKRARITAGLDPNGKGVNGQFMTPAVIARAMADMFPFPNSDCVTLLDPGAGSGSLTSAFLDRLFDEGYQGKYTRVTAYERDEFLADEFQRTAHKAVERAEDESWRLEFSIYEDDFIASAVSQLKKDLFSEPSQAELFTHAIINPPYRKLSTSSSHRKLLDSVGIHVNNLYSAFVALAIELLEEGGHLVAITPRSFCNGPYFRPFRQLVLSKCRFERIHVFESRKSAFNEEAVLQENIIFHLKKTEPKRNIVISSSAGRDFDHTVQREVPHGRVVGPDDPESIIHIPVNEFDEYVLERMRAFPLRLADLNLQVSTGPVVDFRVREYIEDEYQEGMAPLVYPSHFDNNIVRWPRTNGRKPNAIQIGEKTSKWLLPNGNYVLTRRFSSKEEKRRIYPAVFTAIEGIGDVVGFENHVNVIHSGRQGLDLQLAKGLTVYLSSTIVDLYFRQFSGHTQVNAGDLRILPFPENKLVQALASFHDGKRVNTSLVDQQIEKVFRDEFGIISPNPVE